MKKIKVLVVPSDRTGVSHFRSTNPHIALENNYPDEFMVDIDYEPQLNNDAWLKQYDIIHYHRTLGAYEKMGDTFTDNGPKVKPTLIEGLISRLKRLGIVSIMDLDDHWAPGIHHPAYHLIKNAKLDEKIVNNLKVAENVTTTTSIFANEMSKHNKNIYVLPNAINPSEKQFKPNLEPSTGRLRIGWLGGSCYDNQTEVLTDDGWKLFKDLNKTEEVLTLNPDNNIEYQKPIRYIDEPYKGKLNIGKNRLIDYAVTPNHNMYVSKIKNLTHKKLNYELIHSEDVHGQDLHFKRDGVWDKKDIAYFGITNENGEEVNRFEMDDWLKFFGFWLADGWTSNVKYGYQTGICQVKDNDYLEIINSIMEKYGYKPYINENNKSQYRYSNKNLWFYLSQFGKANEKFIPRTILDNLNKRQLKILLDWYIKGDGHIEKNKYGRSRAWTVSTKLAGNLQELALKIGVAATISNRGKRSSILDGRLIEGRYDCLQIGFSKHPDESKHNQLTPLLRSEDQHQIDYDGRIYCVEVPNHILYVRRNGKAFWCGNSHLKDLEILNGVVSKLKSNGLLDKVQFVLCGFDLRGTRTEIDTVTKKEVTRPIKPHESVWYLYEKIFTNNYTSISPEYKNFLMKFKQEEFPNIANEPYRRVWTKPISSYASNYNLFDVSLAPLEENMFNKVKSQLKIIEAGFHHKAIIAQNFGPYQIDLTNAAQYGGTFDLTGNGILIDKNRNHKDWYSSIKKLINNPDIITTLQENLHNTVKETYSLDKVTEDRRNLYLNLIKNNKKNKK